MLTGSQVSALEQVLVEHFAPKEKINLIICISGELSPIVLDDMQHSLENSGLEFVKPTQFGTADNLSYALYMSFRRPNRRRGFAALGIASFIDDLLNEQGLSIISWKIV